MWLEQEMRIDQTAILLSKKYADEHLLRTPRLNKQLLYDDARM
jgi:hypothetical protein